MSSFATVDDVISLWKPLTPEEKEQAEKYLEIISDNLRMSAKALGKDIDQMIADGDILESVAKSVTVDILQRHMEQLSSERSSTLQTEQQSALGYSWSGTYVNTGGGLSILKKDLKRVGLYRQRYGFIDIYGIEGN